MKSIEKQGKTVEEALNAALKDLQAEKEEVEYQVLEEPSKGLFGILARMARVKVTLKESPAKLAKKFVQEVFKEMEIEAQTEVQVNGDLITLTFHGDGLGILIGRRGETLDALQYLVNLAVNRRLEKRVRIILDVEGYRLRREETLIRLAQRLSEKAKRTGQKILLEPMNPHERRIIHTALQNDRLVNTMSEGEEPFRKVVIRPKIK
ncbi:MAG: protein jag [Syntrophomonadaceae bacterium]|nr:protein jag [Syntrophomonadaceae bacterium]